MKTQALLPVIISSLLLAGLSCLGDVAQAQNKPYVVHETRPVITHGPYLVAPSETGVTVVWTTDRPAHSRVVYGPGDSLAHVAEPVVHGMLPVDTLHTVRLTGLTAGQTYRYRVVSTGVAELKPYWPEKTLRVASPAYSFTTTDSRDETVSFGFITDTQHEDLPRLNANLELFGWGEIDFLVHGGDALGWVKNERQLFAHFLAPIAERLDHHTPLVFARGNHDARGPYARHVYEHVPTGSEHFYYAFNAGPLHVIVLDTGEDKPDTTNVYAALNRFENYRKAQRAWLERHMRTEERVADAPFTVVLLHQPRWGAVEGEGDAWTKLANAADVDLVIAGHWHRFARIPPGEWGNDYPVLVVDQDQVATVTATEGQLHVVVTGKEGGMVDTFTLSNERTNNEVTHGTRR